jgi:hypothetical protein
LSAFPGDVSTHLSASHSALAGAVAGAGSHVSVAAGYALGAALMLAAGIIAARFCIPAERKPLEVVAPPLWQSDDL